MWHSIDLNKIDNLLKNYLATDRSRDFSEFIKSESDVTDSIGVVTPEDFENNFSKKFIEDNFEDLAYSWFKCLSSQADFGIILDVIKEEMDGKNGDN